MSIKSVTLLNIISEFCPDLQPNGCFCGSCRQKLIFKIKYPESILLFKKVSGIKDLCFLSKFGLCDDLVRTSTSMYTLTQFESTFCIKLDCEFPSKLPLCNLHHMKLYNKYKVIHCACCRMRLRQTDQKYSCASIDDDLLVCSNRLSSINVNIDLIESDILCLSCKIVATKLDVIESNLYQIQSNILQPDEVFSVSARALNPVLQKLSEVFINRNGVLLSDLYERYVEEVQKICSITYDDDSYWEMFKNNASWLFSNIYSTFGNVIETVSDTAGAKKRGIMLIHRHTTYGNLKSALHTALAKIRNLEQSISHSKLEEVEPNSDWGASGAKISAMLQCTVPLLNEKLRAEAIKITNKYARNPDEVSTFSYDNILLDLDPLIWNMVTVLTMTVDERKYFESTDISWETDYMKFPMKGLYSQQRFHRRINACLNLHFTMNEDFNYPLHIIHANCIKHLSHSSKLLQLLNQAGLCVSENVLHAFLERAKSSKSKDLSLKPFTVISIDNIDVLSPYAAVSSTSDSRSWHGTSILAQQPLPKTQFWKCTGEYLNNPMQPKFKKVKVYGDGRCFYRAVVSYLCPLLLYSERNMFGIPTSCERVEIFGGQVNLFDYERILAESLQCKITNILFENIAFLDSLPDGLCKFLLEDQSAEYFDSFHHRIAEKKEPGNYAGYLEIAATSLFLQREIHIYQYLDGEFKLTAKFPPTSSSSEYHICLLYESQKPDSPGHFDLLYLNSCRLPNENSLVEIDEAGDILFSKADNSISLTKLFVHDSPVQDGNTLHEFEITPDSKDCHDPPIAKYTKKPSYCGNKKPNTSVVEIPPQKMSNQFKTYVKEQVTLERFEISNDEAVVSDQFHSKLFLYILERYTSVTNLTPVKVPGLKCKLALENPSHCEGSNFKYMCVMDEKADKAETIESVLADLYIKFKINDEINHIVVAGDAATYDLINRVKSGNGGYYDWVIPYLGDWHIIKNTQEVLMKLFWDAGVKYVPKCTSMQTTLRNIKSCTNFKKTHRFILQIYESLYMYQLKSFMEFREGSSETNANENILSIVADVVSSLTRTEGCFDADKFIQKQSEITEMVDKFKQEFDTFCDDMSSKFETFRVWDRFIRHDCFGYIELWIALRSRDWDMRNHALKLLTPLFRACDRHNYSKFIPSHLAQMMALPEYTLEHFKQGGFASNIKGTNYSSVGIDEAHECTINKDCKMSLSKSLPKNMNQIAQTVQHAAQIVCNYEKELGATRKQYLQRDFSPSVIENEVKNIQVYFNRFCTSGIFDLTQKQELFQAFTKVPATLPQQKDMLTFRDVGKLAVDLFIKFAVVKDGSVAKLPIRKLHLHTFSQAKVTKRKQNYIEKETKLVTLCYKRTIMLSNELNMPVKDLCQFLESPRAICTANNLPHHGQKSVVYNIFEKRYLLEKCPVLENFDFPQNKTCLIAEGMNIIHSKPLGFFRTFLDYAHHIVSKWVVPYFSKFKYTDVRILFDMPSGSKNPKIVEQTRRDKGSIDIEDMTYDVITDATKIPSPSRWADFLSVRQNKRLLCSYLSHKFIELVPPLFTSSDQQFVTSGGFLPGSFDNDNFVGVVVTFQGPIPHLVRHNHEETDTQIWLHVKDTLCPYVHIYSVDRDIALVGLPLMNELSDKTVLIQFTKPYDVTKYLHLNILKKSLEDDGDLGYLANEENDVCKIIQMVYIVSGCDFVSYFARLGKRKFYDVLFQHAGFISGNSTDLPGKLNYTDITAGSYNAGLLSFYRLIACVYFQANRACLNQYNTPKDIMKSISSQGVEDAHHQLLNIIRRATWKGVYEDQLLPTDDALELHWKRSCWVGTLWGNALQENLTVPNICDYGWAISDSKVSFIWDSDTNINAIRTNVKYLTRGCGCHKSGCTNNKCSCQKNGRTCGPGCNCPKNGISKCQNIVHVCQSTITQYEHQNTITNNSMLSQMQLTSTDFQKHDGSDVASDESDDSSGEEFSGSCGSDDDDDAYWDESDSDDGYV